MDLGTISSRYARALFSLAKEKGEDGRVYDDLKVLKESLHETKELLTTLCNPMVANCKKETLLVTAAGGSVCGLYKRFVQMLLNHGRENCLPIIIYHYMDMYRKDKRISRVLFSSAAPVAEATEKHLIERLHQLTGHTIEFVGEVKPELIGGFRLQLDNNRLDASYATRLRDIRERLLERK